MICMFCQRISIIYSSRILWLNTPNESWIPVKTSPNEFTLQRVSDSLYSLETSLKRCLGWMWRRIRSQIKKSRLPVNPLFQARLPIPPLKLLFQALLPLIQNLNQSHLFFLCWFFICLIFCFFCKQRQMFRRGEWKKMKWFNAMFHAPLPLIQNLCQSHLLLCLNKDKCYRDEN